MGRVKNAIGWYVSLTWIGVIGLTSTACGTSADDEESPPSSRNTEQEQQGWNPVAGDGLFVGVDGKHDYGVLVPLDIVSNDNEAIAKVEKISYTPSPDVVETIKTKILEMVPDLGEEMATQLASQEHQVTRITGEQAGTANVRVRQPFGLNQEERDTQLTVIAYPSQDVDLGQQYYVAGQDSCDSCHGGEREDVPTHLLGQVFAVSDQGILDLLEKNVPFVPGTSQIFDHKYVFDSTEERRGIVAYLRMLQEKDIDALTKIAMESAQIP